MSSKAVLRLTAALVLLHNSRVHGALPELPPAPPAQSVSELLLLDASQAIANERARQGKVDLMSPASKHSHENRLPAQPDHSLPVLNAIYGVGHRLHARVLINGQTALFSSGLPQALAEQTLAWRLKRISPPCVELESDHSLHLRLCTANSGAPP